MSRNFYYARIGGKRLLTDLEPAQDVLLLGCYGRAWHVDAPNAHPTRSPRIGSRSSMQASVARNTSIAKNIMNGSTATKRQMVTTQ